MSRPSILVCTIVLSALITSVVQPTLAKTPHHPNQARLVCKQASERHYGDPRSPTWTDSYVAFTTPPQAPSTIYTGGWSALAGR